MQETVRLSLSLFFFHWHYGSLSFSSCLIQFPLWVLTGLRLYVSGLNTAQSALTETYMHTCTHYMIWYHVPQLFFCMWNYNKFTIQTKLSEEHFIFWRPWCQNIKCTKWKADNWSQVQKQRTDYIPVVLPSSCKWAKYFPVSSSHPTGCMLSA